MGTNALWPPLSLEQKKKQIDRPGKEVAMNWNRENVSVRHKITRITWQIFTTDIVLLLSYLPIVESSMSPLTICPH